MGRVFVPLVLDLYGPSSQPMPYANLKGKLVACFTTCGLKFNFLRLVPRLVSL